MRVAVARITAEDGSSGFGPCRATRAEAKAVLGQRLQRAFLPASGATPAWLPLEYPLFDLVAGRASKPVFALAAALAGRPLGDPRSLRVPCYDTSLYFDDLHLGEHEAGAALIAAEARQGWERGHRHFKIKVGRGAMHMPLEAGTRRDIAVVRAVRAAVGPQATLMLDANNGFNLNLARRVLLETADCGVYWLEEAFYEDFVLYRQLVEWMAKEGLRVLIADGEGQASPQLMDWAREGAIDVVQFDWLSHGFTQWLATGRQLDAWGVRAAPHHYGGGLGNYVSGHLAAAIRGFTFVEWDDARLPVVDASVYSLRDGYVTLPEVPGFGLGLDEAAFAQAVAVDGFVLE